MAYNHVALQGRLVRDPELKVTPTGTSFCNFSIAVDSDFKNSEGNKSVDFFDCVAFKNTAEFVSKYFTKGKMILVSGSLHTNSYKDKEGKPHKSVSITAQNAYFCGDRETQKKESETKDKSTEDKPKESKPSTGANYADTNNEYFTDIKDLEEELPF